MILITGANGQLGTELRRLLDQKKVTYYATDTQEMDITNKAEVNVVFEKVKPSIVFHCAAYTAVDAAEEDGKELNWAVNVNGTRTIASATKEAGAVMVYISTDYVFDGNSEGEYTVDSSVNPQNEYGKAKLAGEEIVQELCPSHYIVRTSWVFGEYGKNFVFTMLKLAETRDTLTVVNDQIGRPTWTKTLADFLFHVYETKPDFGIYHLSNDDSCSWFEFAKEILKDKEVTILPVTSEEYPQKAYRPKHSIMDLSKAKATGFKIPSWQEGLTEFTKSL